MEIPDLGAALGMRVESVVPLGSGQDNVAYEVNGELIVRLARQPDPERLDREARLLTLIAGLSPLPVPEPCLVLPDLGGLVYPKLAGVPLLDLPRLAEPDVAVAAALGELLAVLHAVPEHRVAGLVEPDDDPLADWLAETAETYPAVAEAVPAAHRGAVETFLTAPLPAARDALVFTHNDLGIEHVLVDPNARTATGVIDWTDAALTDPAHDFGCLYRDLGPAALDAALDRPQLRERAEFYARCGAIEDLAYGLKSGQDKYVRKSIGALAWLFPAG